MRTFRYTLLATTLSVTACTTQPLPGGLTGANTAQIVRKIRCEAKDAVLMAAAAYQEKNGAPAGTKNPSLYFGPYNQAVLAYDFTFDITSAADNGVTLSFNNPFSNGKRTLGLGGNVNLQNQNIRNFRLADTFDELMTIESEYCRKGSDASVMNSGTSIQPGKALYPITGKVGIGEEIDTFLELNQTAKFLDKQGQTVPTFADTRDFLTVLSGSITPSIELKDITGGVGLASAGLTHKVTRTDKHTLGIVITLPTPKPAEAAGKGRGKAAPAKESESETKTRAVNELIFQNLRNTDSDVKRKLDRLTDGLVAE